VEIQQSDSKDNQGTCR